MEKSDTLSSKNTKIESFWLSLTFIILSELKRMFYVSTYLGGCTMQCYSEKKDFQRPGLIRSNKLVGLRALCDPA